MLNKNLDFDYTLRVSDYIKKEFEASANYLPAIGIKALLMAVQDHMQHQYDFLQAVAKSDPGTAGKECQQIFKKFLQEYLGPEIEVIMDGRVFLGGSKESPQIDLILVRGMPLCASRSYVPIIYVVAAFEVKLTLLSKHLKKFMKPLKICGCIIVQERRGKSSFHL